MKHTINYSRGFTLIELLVVIAIIGILATVILSSLNTARDKGNEAKISAQISGGRSAAGVYYDTNTSSYGTADNDCASGMFADTASGMSAIVDTVNNYPSGTTMTCDASDTEYALKAAWTDGGGAVKYWCVDGTGSAIIGTTTDMAITGDSNCDVDDV